MACHIDSCTNEKICAWGMCEPHYRKWRRHGTATPLTLTEGGPAIRDPLARFWEKVDKTGLNGCWLWTGTKYTSGGYGNFWDNKRGRKVLAHRYSYELAKGVIPEGMDVMHSCDNRICVNPSHLSVGTRKDNLADMARKGRGTKPTLPMRTHCKHGHPLKDNVYIVPTNHLRVPTVRCKTCVYETNQKQAARRKRLGLA